MIRRALAWVAARLEAPRIIVGRDGRSPYLSRWYLLGAPRDSAGRIVAAVKGQWRERLPVNVFLHRFHRSDDDGALHSHPWKWSLALVLAGGYSEERRAGDGVFRRTVGPLSLNFIRADDYHRVDLLEADAWTLFVAGPKAGTWFFWDREKKARAGWREFCNWTEGHGPEPRWESDRREKPVAVEQPATNRRRRSTR